MNPYESVRLPAEANPLWRWERPRFFLPLCAAMAPVVFVVFVAVGGFRTFCPTSPHAAYCGNCAFGDIVQMAVVLPLGTIVSSIVGATVGGILDCIPNRRGN